MKDWIVSISAVVIITAIVSLILPEGKLGKHIKSIFSIFIVFTIIKPIIYIKDNDFNYQNIFNQDNIELQYDFIDYISNEKIEEYEKNCVDILEQNGIKKASVKLTYSLNNTQEIIIKFVSVDLKNSVINSDKAHIDIINEIKKLLATYLNIGIDLVNVYE